MIFNEPVSLTDIVGLLVSLVFLAIAAVYDLKTREVSDKVWLAYGLIALAITALRLYSGFESIYLMTISIVSSVILSVVMAHLGVFGGADAKAMICLSLAVPLVPVGFRYAVLWFLVPFFPLIILALGYLLSFSMSLFFAIKNVCGYLRYGSSTFDGFHDESFIKKIFVVLTGYRCDFEMLKASRFLYPMERIVPSNEGLRRRFDLSLSIADEKDNSLSSFLEALPSVGNPEMIWVTPGLPMIVFFLLAVIVVVLVNL
ncbi:MAG: A24 family peptidase C-terminal domain-containing protein [Candidatus Bathyarchaeia archaeon]